ncbi:hypothetical protein ACRAWF_21720 [Streptomyces sp. L7]
MTRAMVSAAVANGTPGWSTAELRFSSVKVTPALSPSSARRVRGAVGGDPHRTRGLAAHRNDRQALGVQACAVQVEARAAQLVGGLDRLLGGAQEFGGTRLVGEAAPDVARHRRELGRGARERVQVVRVQSQISTWKPASWMRRARSWIGRSRKTISAQTANVYMIARPSSRASRTF